MERFEREAATQAELLELIDAAWPQLRTIFDGTDADALVRRTDAAGWSAKDHLAHITAWEQGMISFFRSEPRFIGMGVPADVWAREDVDEINDVIFQRIRHVSLDDVKADADATHAELRAMLAGLDEGALRQPYGTYQPQEGPGGPSAMSKASGNTHWHYAEHIPWIREILERQ
jgi:hypothetical protein